MAIGYIIGGGGGGVVSSDVTAKKENVLTGTSTITLDSDDAVVNGTMPNIGKVTQTLGVNGTYTIPKGYHNGTGTVSQSITTKGATTYYPSTSDQTIAANQYLTGAQTIKAISQQNLTAANIKKGVTVYVKNGNGNLYAVTGTWEGYVTNTSSPYNHGVWLSGWNIAGCAKPSGTGFFTDDPLSHIQYNATSFRVYANQHQGIDGWFFYLPYKPMNGINNINISYIGTWGVSSSYPMVLGVTAEKPPNGISGSENTQTNYHTFTAYSTSTSISSTQETTLTINISGINTNQYIIFGPTFYSNYTDYIDITHIWFS